jgi:hypothetical protein
MLKAVAFSFSSVLPACVDEVSPSQNKHHRKDTTVAYDFGSDCQTDDCPLHEHCKLVTIHSEKRGVCHCDDGYSRDSATQSCQPDSLGLFFSRFLCVTLPAAYLNLFFLMKAGHC